MGETRVDFQHLLEDLRDAYAGEPDETILTEVVANALDSGAMHIRLLTDSGRGGADDRGRWPRERWMIQHKGTVNAAIKGQPGESAVSGSLDGAFLRVTAKDGDSLDRVRATVDGDTMDGERYQFVRFDGQA